MALSPITFVFTVDAIGNPEAIVIQSDVVKVVTLREDNQDSVPTLSDFLVRVPDLTSPPIRYSGGSTCTIIANYPARLPFFNGDIVGYIETIAGSASFVQSEDIT